jgi:hypothetical protein
MKKNLFRIGLVFSMMLGVVFSISIESVQAKTISEKDDIDNYPCYYQGTGWRGQYVDCANCSIKNGYPEGSPSTCS